MPSGTREFLTPQIGKKGFNLLVVLTGNGGRRVLELWAKISMLVLGRWVIQELTVNFYKGKHSKAANYTVYESNLNCHASI